MLRHVLRQTRSQQRATSTLVFLINSQTVKTVLLHSWEIGKKNQFCDEKFQLEKLGIE